MRPRASWGTTTPHGRVQPVERGAAGPGVPRAGLAGGPARSGVRRAGPARCPSGRPSSRCPPSRLASLVGLPVLPPRATLPGFAAFAGRPARRGGFGSKRRSTVSTGSSSRSPPCSVTDRRHQAEPLQRPPVGRQLLGGRSPLHRHQGAAGLEQRHAPASQLVEAGDGSGRHERRRDRSGQVLGTAPVNRHVVERQLVHHAREPLRATQHRLHEVHLEVGANDRQRHPGQPGPRPHVDQPGPRRKGVLHDGAVQHVPVPETGDLPGTDQPVASPRCRRGSRRTGPRAASAAPNTAAAPEGAAGSVAGVGSGSSCFT